MSLLIWSMSVTLAGGTSDLGSKCDPHHVKLDLQSVFILKSKLKS